jgi:DNA-binding GntR family transcriptional regulator
MARERAAGNEKVYLALDTAFHQLIFEHAGNDYLTASYTRYVGKIAALRTHLAKLPQHTELSFEEHHGIARAVREGDMQVIRSLLAEHIDRTRQAYKSATIVLEGAAAQ